MTAIKSGRKSEWMVIELVWPCATLQVLLRLCAVRYRFISSDLQQPYSGQESYLVIVAIGATVSFCLVVCLFVCFVLAFHWLVYVSVCLR